MYAHSSAEPGSAARQRVVAVLTAIGFALTWRLWVGDTYMNVAEDGYLWYGTWRAGFGELPLRDFQSYDPGRYLACAALGKVFGSGLLGLRSSLAVFQALGLSFGLLAARRAVRSPWPLVPIGIVLGLWMFPPHKVFESALASASTWVGLCLLERPTRGRHLAAGVCTGLVAFFGRNFGAYTALAFVVLIVVSALRRRDVDWPRKSAGFVAGVVLGYSPMLVMFVVVPGFWQSFVDSMLLLLRLGPNIPSPWLWPWRVELADLSPYQALMYCALAVMYLLPVIVLPIGIVGFLCTRAEGHARRALFFAAAAVGSFCIHHASVRSDPPHFAQALQPTLLACVGLVAWILERHRRTGFTLACLLGAAAFLAGWGYNPTLYHVGRIELVATKLGTDSLRLFPTQANYYERLTLTLGSFVRPDDTIFFAPSRPLFYPLFEKRSPSWWIYFFVPEADRAEQEAIIGEIAEVDWALIVDVPVADLEELRFQNSYPLVWDFIQSNFLLVPTPALEARHLLYRRRD